MIPIPPIATGQKIAVSEFITIRTFESKTDIGTLIAVSNWVQNLTLGGITYEGLGPFISVGSQTRQLKNSQVETVLSLVGIDPTWLQLILSGITKGGLVTIARGFFDSSYVLQNNTLYGRYAGVITGWNVQENFDDASQSRTCSLTISSSSLDMLLDQRNGRFTNTKSWQQGSPTDTSMNRVAALQNVFFSFGQKK